MEGTIDYSSIIEKILEQETSEEMLKIRKLIMLRMAMEGEINVSRMPAPRNITEVGGYYNLLVKQKEQTMLRQLISSALGLPNNYAPELTEEIMKGLLVELLKK